jgi:hypothetical protein
MQTQSLKTGTRIELYGTPAMGSFPGVPAEQATIGRWTAINGAVKNRAYPDGKAGWHVVRFADGARMLVNETNFRVIDNR